MLGCGRSDRLDPVGMSRATTRPFRGADHEVVLALLLHGPSTRAELVRRTGLSRATVSAATYRLLGSGRLESLGTEPAHPAGRRPVGRAPGRLALSVSGAVLLGIEFGHRRVTATAMDEAHRIVASASTDHEQATAWADRISIALTLLDDLGIPGRREVIAIGLGVPGRIADREQVTRTLISTFATRTGAEVRADNNARLAGLAESVWGTGQDLQSFVYLRLMDGVGGALISHGTIYDGLHGTAGEFGHMTVDPGGPECRCGKHGCPEAYVSRERILAATAQRSLASLREVLDAGDARRREIIAVAGRQIGVVLANACTALDAQGVVLGGDLMLLGDHLTDPLSDALAESLMPERAGAVGGIALVLRDPTISLSAATNTSTSTRKARISP